ncbi:peptidoglycan-binding protein [Streptomyces xanthophaeus]|uniref:peptidoglycan-binding domain-containing protein n=1 Tax=Streptomyces xanthophaeus TaxID=67385 RepID=UPI003421CE93
MSHHSEEDGVVPDDRLLVRPYVVPVDRASPPTATPWPQSGPVPVSFRVPERAPAYPAPESDREPDREPDRDPDRGPGRGSGAEPAPAPLGTTGSRAHRRADARRGGRRSPVATLALLGLGAAGVLAYLFSTPGTADPSPSEPSPGLTLAVPALPAGSPDGDGPSPEGSASGAPSASSTSASASPSASASAAASPSSPSASPKAGAAASASAGQSASGTLRMGDSGEAVRDLQERLYGQGFTYVSTTGVFDSQTKRGVAQLQRDRGIKGDQPGVYGPATQAAFGG